MSFLLLEGGVRVVNAAAAAGRGDGRSVKSAAMVAPLSSRPTQSKVRSPDPETYSNEVEIIKLGLVSC